MGALQLIVHPEAAHGVVADGGVLAHGDFVGVTSSVMLLVHVEEVAVALAEPSFSAEAGRWLRRSRGRRRGRSLPYPVAFVAQGLGVAGGDVARDEVAEASG